MGYHEHCLVFAIAIWDYYRWKHDCYMRSELGRYCPRAVSDYLEILVWIGLKHWQFSPRQCHSAWQSHLPLPCPVWKSLIIPISTFLLHNHSLSPSFFFALTLIISPCMGTHVIGANIVFWLVIYWQLHRARVFPNLAPSRFSGFEFLTTEAIMTKDTYTPERIYEPPRSQRYSQF